MVDVAHILGISERSAYGNYRSIADRMRAGFSVSCRLPLGYAYARAANTASANHAVGSAAIGSAADSGSHALRHSGHAVHDLRSSELHLLASTASAVEGSAFMQG